MDSSKSKIGTFILGWGAALILFFPILWMLLTGFKTEAEAIATPPTLFFSPTLENYYAVFERADYMSFAINSIVISVVARALAILIAVPAAYVMAFFPTERTRGTLLWMLSTKMMPPVGVLVPMYLLFRDFGMLDTRTGLIIIYTLMNLPIVIWMLYTFFKEVPGEILEAGRMDGARARQEVQPRRRPSRADADRACKVTRKAGRHHDLCHSRPDRGHDHGR